MPAQQGSLHVQGSTVLAMVALPVSALGEVDDDGDGRLSDTEVQAHLDSIKDQVKARFRLFKGDTPGRVERRPRFAGERPLGLRVAQSAAPARVNICET
jgi:hypothetical protein